MSFTVVIWDFSLIMKSGIDNWIYNCPFFWYTHFCKNKLVILVVWFCHVFSHLLKFDVEIFEICFKFVHGSMQLKFFKKPQKTHFYFLFMEGNVCLYIYFNFASYNKCIAENVMESQNIIMHKYFFNQSFLETKNVNLIINLSRLWVVLNLGCMLNVFAGTLITERALTWWVLQHCLPGGLMFPQDLAFTRCVYSHHDLIWASIFCCT